MPMQHCPVVTGYLNGIKDALPIEDALSADVWDEVRELCALVQETYAMVAAQRLRAFYITEAYYHSLLPSQAWLLDEPELKARILELRLPRSKEGIEELESLLRTLERKVVVRQSCLLLREERGVGGGYTTNDAQLASMLEKPGVVLKYGIQAAELFKTQLRGEALQLKRVGELFGRAFVESGTESQYYIRHARVMLHITPTRGVSPWNTTSEFLESPSL